MPKKRGPQKRKGATGSSVVRAVKGRVKVQQPKSFKFTQLGPGAVATVRSESTLTVPKGGSAQLMSSRRVETIEGGTTMVVGGSSMRPRKLRKRGPQKRKS